MRFAVMTIVMACAWVTSAHAQIGGKKFRFQASADTNAIVPDFFIKRDFVPLKTLAAAGGDLAWFAGRAIYKDGNGDWVFMPVVTKGNPTWVVKIAAVPYSFQSKINRDYKGNAKVPVAEVSAKMTNAYDYEIRDVATINVPDENVPDRAAVEAAMTARGLPTTVPVYWVASVTLTTVSVKTAAEVQAGGTITGVGFSTGASTYNATSAAAFTPLACLGTMPMNEAAIKQSLEGERLKPTVESKPSVVNKTFANNDEDAAAFAKRYAPKLTPGGGQLSNVRVAVN